MAAWVAEFDTRDAGGLDEDERAELIRLRKELAEVKEEREMLRKAEAGSSGLCNISSRAVAGVR